MKTTFWILVGVLLISLALNGVLFFQIVDLAVAKDHLTVRAAGDNKRDVALLRFATAFAHGISKQDLREWIQSHMSDLEIYDQGKQIIVNGVEIRFDSDAAEVR